MSSAMTLKSYGTNRFGKIGCRPLVKSWTARDYVQDGLVAAWDGIEIPYSNGWEDIVGGNVFQADSGTIEFDSNGLATYPGLVLSCLSLSQNLHAALISSQLTIEIVCNKENNNNGGGFGYLPLSSSDPTSYVRLSILSRKPGSYDWGVWYRESMSRTVGTPFTGKKYFSFRYSNGNRKLSASTETGNLVSTTVFNEAASGLTLDGLMMGAEINSNWKDLFNGYMYRIYVYSRSLTDDEIAHNYDVDRTRFNLP